MRAALAFSGPIGSGKSTISATVSDALGIPRASFSTAVRQAATERGIGTHRTALQELGEQLIGEGWPDFCRMVVGQVGSTTDGVVIDGVRHVGAIDALREVLAPLPLYLVFLEASAALRAERVSGRGMTREDLARATAHRNESELSLVRRAADLIVANDRPLEIVVAEIVGAVRTRQISER